MPRRPLWRLTYRALALIVAVVAAVAAGAGIAMAYWSSSGSGTATATTGTLNAPTGVSGVQTAGTGSVVVSWTASTGTPAPTGYYVTRKDTSNNVVAACGTSASSTTPGAGCTDTSVPLGSYTYTVVAVYHTWTATSTPSGSVPVGTASQSITFTTSAPTNATVGGATYAVAASGGGSGNAVTFTSATSGVCTVAGSIVSFAHAGSCTVNADQLGSTYYDAAPTAHQTFAVAKAAQVVNFTSDAPTNAVVGGPSYTVTATGGASGNPVLLTIDGSTASTCSISGATVSFQHVGTCIVDANQAGNTDYLAANQVQQSIAVGKGSQAINFTTTPPSTTQVGGSYTPAATSTSGLTVTISLDPSSAGCTLSSGTVNFTGAGTCVIDANQAGNADYLAAAQTMQSFTITKVNQTITFTSTAPGNAAVGGATYTAVATATSGLAVTFSSATPTVCTASGATFSFIAAGTCIVNANQAGNTQYNAAPQVQQSFTVGKGSQTITFTSTAPASATVGSAGYTPTASATSNLTVAITLDASSTGCTLTSGTVNFTAAGTCRIDANQAGNANYNAAPQVQQSIAVTNPAATQFLVSAGATQTAGTAFTVTITARDASNNTVASYTGAHNITVSSNAGNAPDGTAPTLPSGNVAFSGGIGHVTVTLVKAETGRTITATDGTISGTSSTITVNAGAAARLAWESVSVSQGTLSSPCLFSCTATGMGNFADFTATVGVTDSFGNVVSNLGSGHSVSVSTSGGAFTAPTSGASVTLSVSSTGPALTTQQATLHTQNGGWTSDGLTATSSGFADAIATVTKQ